MAKRSRHATITAAGAWIVCSLLMCGTFAFAYRPWPLLWASSGVAAVCSAMWISDVRRRRAWSRASTRVAAIAVALVAFASIAMLNPQGAFDPTVGKVVPRPHVGWLPAVADVANAWPTTVAIVAALGVCLIATDLGRSARWRRRWIGAFALGGLATATIGSAEHLPALASLRAWDRSSPWSQGEPFGLMSYHNHAATMMNLAVPSIALLAIGASRRRRWIATTLIVATVLAMLLNVSRTGLLIGAILAAVSLTTLWWRDGRPSASMATRLRQASVVAASTWVSMSVTAAVAAPTVADRLKTLDNRWSTYYPRLLQWRGAWELVERHPAFGCGPGGYRMLISTTSTGDYYLGPRYVPGTPFSVTLNAHNDYLQTLVEWGIVGSVGWIALLGGAVVGAGRAMRKPPPGVSRGEVLLMASAAFAIFGHAVVDPPLQAPAFQFIAAVFVGSLWSADRWRGRRVDSFEAFLT